MLEAVLGGGLETRGVVAEHAPRAGAGSLTATPLTAINPREEDPTCGPGVADPAAWWARIGTGPEDLAVLPVPLVQQPPPYLSTLRSMGSTR